MITKSPGDWAFLLISFLPIIILPLAAAFGALTVILLKLIKI